MRNLALSIAAILVLAVVSPAFAQPFADVPTDHWAFDAIAELAAKGIIEGFPDGTFKGDRGVTRYEVAMIVARILARIEAIKIPAPAAPAPAPQVTRADVQTIQRLVNEFRAELAALGVRVTAVEEELTALKAKTTNTAISGDWTYVYIAPQTPLAVPTVDRNRARLIFKGQVPGGPSVFVRARWNTRITGGATVSTPDFDKVYADWTSPWAGLSFRLGRNYWSLGPNGILLDTSNANGVFSSAGSTNGLKVSGSFAGFSYSVLAASKAAATLPPMFYGVNAETTLAGWTVGANYRTDRNGGAGVDGDGWSVYGSGGLFPGFTLSAEYASFQVSGAASGTALWANLAIDTAAMGMGFLSGADAWYKDYKSAFPGGNSQIGSLGGFWLGPDIAQVTGWGVDANVKVVGFNVRLAYESGTSNEAGGAVPAGSNYSVALVTAEYGLAANTTLGLEYRQLQNSTAGTTALAGYAAYVTYKW